MSGDAFTILLLEDNPAHAERFKHSFETCDLETNVIIAGTLEDARKRIAENMPDLVIAEVNLPDGNSIDLLKTGDGVPPFPVIMVTDSGNANRSRSDEGGGIGLCGDIRGDLIENAPHR